MATPKADPRRDPMGARIDEYMRRHPRLWDKRFFRATITATSTPSVGTLCTVVEFGISAVIATHTAMCANPGYTPAVGDDVECMWRDESTCYVLWPL
jgi:hypothetical protein